MKRLLFFAVIFGLGLGLLLSAGCTKKASSASEAIQNSQSLNTVQEKVNYLMNQAQAFYNSKEFQQAIQAAQYVLSNLDRNSQAAKDLIERARAQLQAAVQKSAGDVSRRLLGN